MKPQYYKFAAITFFVLFLFTVLKPQSIALLFLSAYLGYVYFVKMLSSLTQKDLIQLLPKKIKKHIQEKSLAEYVANLEIVQTTPMLNYFVPFLKEMSKDKRNSLDILTQTKTTSALALSNGNSLYQQSQTNENRLKMIREPSSSEKNLGDKLLEQTLKMGLSTHVMSQFEPNHYGKGKMMKQESGNMTTCESTNDHQLAKRPYNSLGKRKSSLVIKKKFAEQSSSNEEPLSNIDHKRIHRSSSQNKVQVKQNTNGTAGFESQNRENKDNATHRSAQNQVQNPIKTVEQYVKALIWMMKRLLGLRKMTSKIRRASIVSVASAAALFWLMVYFQIKMDKKKGKIIFKTLKALVGTILVLSATGTTSILGYKLYKRITVGEEPPRRPQQFSLFGEQNINNHSK